MTQRYDADPLQLTLDQVEAGEERLGAPYQDWPKLSRIKVVRTILVVTGQATDEELGALSVDELAKLSAEADADPSEPSSDDVQLRSLG